MTKRRITIILAVGCVLAAGGTAALVARGDPLHAKARRDWKDQAIGKIERRLVDRQALQSQVDAIATAMAATRPTAGSWVGQGLLVMKNGDWITWRSGSRITWRSSPTRTRSCPLTGGPTSV